MSTITVKDGTTIYYKDWGTGPVVTFSHGWPLSADAWDAHTELLRARKAAPPVDLGLAEERVKRARYAVAMMGDRVVSDDPAPAILVNRAYLRGVEQVDARTGERHERLPGASMGGTNWTDRA